MIEMKINDWNEDQVIEIIIKWLKWNDWNQVIQNENQAIEMKIKWLKQIIKLERII